MLTLRNVSVIAFLSVFAAHCGKKDSKKNETTNRMVANKSESPIVGNLQRAGAIQSLIACTQNYIPGNEEALFDMKNEYFTETDSCVDAGYSFACVLDNINSLSNEKQKGFITWYNSTLSSNACQPGYTLFTDEKTAMEFVNNQLIIKE